MAENRKERYNREKGAKAYEDLLTWAKMEIANEVIRSGFGNIRSVVERIIVQYENYKRDNPP